jgi:hypothetical protein
MKALQGPRLIAVDDAYSEPDLRSDLVRHSGALSVKPQQATRQAGRQIRLPLLIMVKSIWDYRSFVWEAFAVTCNCDTLGPFWGSLGW